MYTGSSVQNKCSSVIIDNKAIVKRKKINDKYVEIVTPVKLMSIPDGQIPPSSTVI